MNFKVKVKSQGQVLKNYLELNSECIFGILDEFPLRIYSFYSSMS